MNRRQVSAGLLACLVWMGSPSGVFAESVPLSNALGAPGWRPIPLWTAEAIPVQCEAALSRASADIASIEAEPVGSDATKLFSFMNRITVALGDLTGPVYLLNNVSPDPAVRKAAEACIVKVSAFSSGLYRRDALYARVRAVQPQDDIDRKLQQDLVRSFERNGVTLTGPARARMEVISRDMSRLQLEFAKRVRDNKMKLSFSPEEMKGVPDPFQKGASKDAQGNTLIGFSAPEVRTFMAYSENDAARERYLLAYTQRGGPRNLEILKELVELRQEMAKLLGYPSFAHFQVKDRMAQSPERIEQFLKEVDQAASTMESKELAEIRAYMQSVGAKGALTRSSLSYWQRRLEEARYKIDPETLRAYFPTEASVDFSLEVASKLYGYDFRRVVLPVWHEDVMVYEVRRRDATQSLKGVIYLDLYPRDGKYGHAAAFGTRAVSAVVGRIPTSVMVANFNRNGLTHDQLETLLHEFGHILHGVLSDTRYAAHAGTAVERDFVEAPSQMFEEWVRSESTLRLLPKHCKPSCPAVTPDLMRRLTASKNFGRGIRYGRQLLYASYDMRLHAASSSALSPSALWTDMEGRTALGALQGGEFPGQFGHIAGGYAAGYYGYMWAEVLALDMLSGFNGRLMNPQAGQRYLRTVLSRGGEQKGMDMVRSFLGRDPDAKAFFREVRGQRLQ
ncbi:Dcp Zn-dependent oligopeptidases [Burkholderiales bacterium]